MTDRTATTTASMFRIWSYEEKAWVCQDGRALTPHKKEAGRFPLDAFNGALGKAPGRRRWELDDRPALDLVRVQTPNGWKTELVPVGFSKKKADATLYRRDVAESYLGRSAGKIWEIPADTVRAAVKLVATWAALSCDRMHPYRAPGEGVERSDTLHEGQPMNPKPCGQCAPCQARAALK